VGTGSAPARGATPDAVAALIGGAGRSGPAAAARAAAARAEPAAAATDL